MIEKLLVANRGEIAIRVIRACRELGIRSVAVYSDADRLSPHVQAADEAYRIGPAPASESYLRGDVILDAALQSAADAVHPGYGFLAERAPFARAVEDAGLIFVGPRPETILSMGDKTEARRRMQAAGVPIVPGTIDPVADAAAANQVAQELGYPVLLKATAGGGGKGMRVVEDPAELSRAFKAASREALSAFGDASVYLEKFLDQPRHVEIQLLGDSHGNVIHLGERECSIQRRHQKLIEEAPSPMLDADTRARMCQAAVDAARAVAYRSAGTVEFLFQGGDFYFLEMNTRIQVEHPTTEMITGVDLVQWQLRIAAGEELSMEQDDIRFHGHAIECRITSEDPVNGFLPSVGRVGWLEVPAGPGVRWDGGITEGSEVGLHYDPLLAKLIVHGPDRPSAIRRMARALDELVITGVDTCIGFHREVMRERDFLRGEFTIAYLEEHPQLMELTLSQEERHVAAVAAVLLEEERRREHHSPRIGASQTEFSAWRRAAHTQWEDER